MVLLDSLVHLQRQLSRLLEGKDDSLLEPLRREPLFVFGTREWTTKLIFDEVLMGLFVSIPLTFLIAQFLLRFIQCKPPVFLYVRADIWHSMMAAIAGDAWLEFLMSSGKCLPTPGMFQMFDYWGWLKTSWGIECYVQMKRDILTPRSLLIVMVIRVCFVLIGLSLGQSFAPIAITGGIATGKSTILNLMIQDEEAEKQETTSKDSTATTEISDIDMSQQEETKQEEITTTTALASEKKNDTAITKQAKQQGLCTKYTANGESVTYYLIDCDKIGHEILLPPQVLSSQKSIDGAAELVYTVQPSESVYTSICQAFKGEDIFQDNPPKDDDDNNNSHSTNTTTPLIDRTKLGALVFTDASKRRTLNFITHGRIAWILVKRCIYGCLWSGADLTIAEVPLFFESPWLLQSLFCLSIMVTVSSPEVQLQRLKQRNPELSEANLLGRIQAQMSLKHKEHEANFVIFNYDQNDASEESVPDQVMAVEQGLMDRLYGLGISPTQIIAIVFVTLVAGFLYNMYYKDGALPSSRV